jgi:competence protein CoiA
MKYALVDGSKAEPAPKLRGRCLACDSEMVPKCGRHVLWHWAHKSLQHCDRWWESETEWHRAWKNLFPVEWQEVVHVDSTNNEKHIADVKTPGGMVLEFQHSPISMAEVKSRESFYSNMAWIVNGRRNDLDRNYFSLSLSKPSAEQPGEFPLRWWGSSKLFANWGMSSRAVYVDFGDDLLWKVLRFDKQTKTGAVSPVDKQNAVSSWAVA